MALPPPTDRVPPSIHSAVLDGPIRVALVHDAHVVHVGLRHLMSPYSARVLVLPTRDAGAARDAHVVLHGDIRPPDFHRVTRGACEVIYSARPRPEAIRRAVDRGAAGFASKDWTALQLVAALEQAVGAAGVPPGRAPSLPTDPDGGPEVELTPRETELLLLIAQGLSNEDIAGLMSVSVNSVKSYVRSAYRKIGVTRRTQAVVWALSHDLDRPTGATSPA